MGRKRKLQMQAMEEQIKIFRAELDELRKSRPTTTVTETDREEASSGDEEKPKSSSSSNESEQDSEEDSHKPEEESTTAETKRDANDVIEVAGQNSSETPNKQLLELLGEDPAKSKALDIQLHESIVTRWRHFVKKGLPKEEKEELLAQYARPEFLEAPILNAEVTRSLKDSTTKRDGYMKEVQHLAGSALVAIGSLSSAMLLAKDSIDQELFFERLRDAGKLLSEIFARQTESRKALIIPALSKEFKEMTADAKTDKFLFGEDMGQKLKDLEAMEKVTKKIKRPLQVTQKENLNLKGLSGRKPSPGQTGLQNIPRARPRLYFNARPQYQHQTYPRSQSTRGFKSRGRGK